MRVKRAFVLAGTSGALILTGVAAPSVASASETNPPYSYGYDYCAKAEDAKDKDAKAKAEDAKVKAEEAKVKADDCDKDNRDHDHDHDGKDKDKDKGGK